MILVLNSSFIIISNEHCHHLFIIPLPLLVSSPSNTNNRHLHPPLLRRRTSPLPARTYQLHILPLLLRQIRLDVRRPSSPHLGFLQQIDHRHPSLPNKWNPLYRGRIPDRHLQQMDSKCRLYLQICHEIE